MHVLHVVDLEDGKEAEMHSWAVGVQEELVVEDVSVQIQADVLLAALVVAVPAAQDTDQDRDYIAHHVVVAVEAVLAE